GRKVFARDGGPASAQPGVAENGRAAIPTDVAAPQPDQSTPAAALPPPAAHRPPSPAHELPVFAALDLGTNNCRLLVAVPTRYGQFRVIDAFSRIVRLGEGLSASGRLGDAAMDRAVEALKI